MKTIIMALALVLFAVVACDDGGGDECDQSKEYCDASVDDADTDSSVWDHCRAACEAFAGKALECNQYTYGESGIHNCTVTCYKWEDADGNWYVPETTTACQVFGCASIESCTLWDCCRLECGGGWC